jgi:hypothetical protein
VGAFERHHRGSIMKDKGIFGASQTRKGAHIQSNQEWSEFENGVTNINVGDNNFTSGHVDNTGTYIPSDAFFFPHVGQIEVGSLTAIIGPEREEDWYPYIDAVAVPKVIQRDQFQLQGGVFLFFGQSDRETSTTSVLFPTPKIYAPAKPTDNADAGIVGYQWTLQPTVTSVVFSAGGSVMDVTTEWVAGEDFDTDTQASMYSVDSGSDPSSWAPSSEDDATFETIEDLINTYLTDEGEPNVIIGDISNWEVSDKLTKIPIASYQWNVGQSKIERVVQLYFGGSAPGSAGDSRNAESTLFDHPHKGEVSDYQSIVVGRLRADASYKFKDSITITDPDSDALIAIDYPTAETIALTASTDAYVFYDLYKNGSVWDSTLSKSAVWPPAVSIGNIAKLIGYAASTNNGSTDTFIWGQEMFDCPNEQPASIRGQFEPFYSDDGSVTIAAGTVATFDNDTHVTGESTFSLAAPKSIWVRCESVETSGAPDVTITGLQSGTYPGFFESVSATTKRFNYKIGEIAGGVYIPSHKGRLHIDTTLLTPDISADYSSADQTPRLMAFHDDQVTSVGSTDNDLLVEAEFLDTEVRGGGIEKMTEGTAVKMYGLTDSTFSQAVFDVINTDTIDEITFQGLNIELESDHGLMQTMDNSTAISDVIIKSDGKWIGIEKGGVFWDMGSPVTSTGDAEHWFSTGALTIASSTDTMELFFDVKGRCWKYNSSTQPPPVDNWRYRHCSDPTGNPDLIFASQQANSVILVDDECYDEVGETEEDVTSPAPTVSNTYSTCAACEADKDKEYWKKCSDDTDVAVLTDVHTDVDYAWLCISSAWVKCYNDRPTSVTSTNPTVLKQCGLVGAPTSCLDLTGWPSDDFSTATGCDTASIGDQNYDVRWSPVTGNYVFSMNGSQFQAANTTFEGWELVTNTTGSSGDRETEVDWSGTFGSGTDIRLAILEFRIGGGFYTLGRVKSSSGVTDGYWVKVGVSTVYTLEQSDASGTLKMFYDTSASEVKFYINGVLKYTRSSVTGNATAVKLGGQGVNQTIKMDNFRFDDGAGTSILIDPSGESCT